MIERRKLQLYIQSFGLFLFLSLVFSPTSNVYGILDFKKGMVIRDSETEQMLKEFLNPIFEVAGLVPGSEKIIIVVDPEMNAAASIGQLLIINTGFLIQSKTVWDVIGVLAHETGHLAGNHISRREDSMRKMMTPTLITGFLGTAAAVLAAGMEGGAAAALGAMHVAERSFLQYNRGQEASADQAALRYLDALHWSAQGLYDTFQELSGQELFLTKNQDPYVQTHPLTQERLDTIKQHLLKSPYTKSPPPKHFEDMFHRVHTKLLAFLLAPSQVLQKYPLKDQSLEGHYARTIAYLRLSQTEKALKEIDTLLRNFPNDPFFLEMKGQILFISGRIEESIGVYEKAVAALPEDASIKLSLIQAFLEKDTPSNLERAVSLLDKILAEDPEEVMAWRFKAIALGKQNKIGLAALCLSEFSLRTEDKKQAKLQADRALHTLQKGSPAFQRAQDIKNSLELTDSGPKSKY